jgi:hypothetical protein
VVVGSGDCKLLVQLPNAIADNQSSGTVALDMTVIYSLQCYVMIIDGKKLVRV